jgi:hypothetical protein
MSSAYLTDKSRWRSTRLWLHLGHPASPNKGGSSSRDMGACSLRTVACRYLSRSSRAPCRSADCNRAQSSKTSNTSPQESVVDFASPERGSLQDRGKYTMDGCRAAFSCSLRILSWLSPQTKGSFKFAGNLILQEAGVTTRGTAGC